MDVYDIFSLANIAGALVAIAWLLAFIAWRLDHSTRDGLGAWRGRRGQK